MSDDFLCLGYRGMADAVRDHKGKRIFTPEQIRRRFSKELKENRVLFKIQIAKGQPRRCCIWFSQLQAYLRAKGLGLIEKVSD